MLVIPRDHRDDTDQVPEKLKEVCSDLINRLDFNEELGKDVHNEVKKDVRWILGFCGF